MIRLVNFDLVMYVLIQAAKDLQRDGRPDLAKLVELLAHDLQEGLDDLEVKRCPFCRGHFRLAQEEEFYDEDT